MPSIETQKLLARLDVLVAWAKESEKRPMVALERAIKVLEGRRR